LISFHHSVIGPDSPSDQFCWHFPIAAVALVVAMAVIRKVGMKLFDECVAELRAFSFHDLQRHSICDAVADAAKLRAALDAFEARAASAVGELADDGPGASTVLRGSARCSQREADRRAHRATALGSLPGVASALASGLITIEHVDSLLRATEATSADAVEQSGLVRKAASRPADLFSRDVRDWTRANQEPADADEAQRRRRAGRKLRIFESRSGMTILHGEFDPISGAQLRSLLEGEADRLYRADGGRDAASCGAAEGARTSEQRLADALVGMLLGSSSAGGGRQPVRSQMIVLVHPDGSAEIPGRGPVPPAELSRLACNSDFYGVLFSVDGVPLWHGRRVRLASDSQWRALIARDRGCVVCGAAPSRCEAHHIVPWSQGGVTDLEAMALICSHHHHLVHDFGYRLRRRGDGSWSLDPPGDPATAQSSSNQSSRRRREARRRTDRPRRPGNDLRGASASSSSRRSFFSESRP